MKIRQGFVSNSSSSSFIIKLSDITDYQITQIQNVNDAAKILELPNLDCICDWHISFDYTENQISFYTSMDNFDFYEFLIKIGIPDDKIIFGD